MSRGEESQKSVIVRGLVEPAFLVAVWNSSCLFFKLTAKVSLGLRPTQETKQSKRGVESHGNWVERGAIRPIVVTIMDEKACLRVSLLQSLEIGDGKHSVVK